MYEKEMQSKQCPNCANEFENSTSSQISKTRGSKYFSFAVWLIFIIGVMAIVLGYICKIPVLTYESPISAQYNQYENTYNYSLALLILFGDVILAYFMLVVNSILEELREIKEKIIK